MLITGITFAADRAQVAGHSFVIGLSVFLEQISRDELLVALIALKLPDANVNVAHVDL